MNKQQLASKIWETANKMRPKIDASEYKDYILGFIFYKFLSENEVKYALSQPGWNEDNLAQLLQEDNSKVVNSFQNKNGYFISHENLFQTWLQKGHDLGIDDVRDALSAFTRLLSNVKGHLYKDIFLSLETGLSKLGANAQEQSKAVRELVHLINIIPMNQKQDYDVLGFIYEYLIGMFAADAGKKAGEFYTPHEVSVLMSEIVANHLKDRDTIEIYDPTSGSGSLLINIGKSAAKYLGEDNKIKYYAQELKQNTYNLTRMNLVMRGILSDNIKTRHGDALEKDWPYFDESDPVNTYEPLYVDAVVSNPPYSQMWSPTDMESDPRYARYGLAPKGKADYAFLLNDLYHVKPDGIATIVLPHGVLFRGGEEGNIRKNLIENNNIDAIIGLPPNIFFGTGIPTIIMVLKQKRDNNDVLIIDASKGFIKEGKNNKLRASDIKRIADTVASRLDIEKYSRVVSKDEIRQNDYNLNIPRYVDSSESAESWDIYASMFGGVPKAEIEELNKYWAVFDNLKAELFENPTDEYTLFKTDDIKNTVANNKGVKSFEAEFSQSFSGFDEYLYKLLIRDIDKLNVNTAQEVITEDIFKRLEGTPLIDKYQAYQILDDNWQTIGADIETIKREGFSSVKSVDPKMVLKKKGSAEHEIQEGWIGRILPFELIQDTILQGEKDALNQKQVEIDDIAAQLAEILENLTEDEKENDFVNEAGDAFVNAEIKKALKSGAFIAETLDKLKQADKLINKDKSLRKELKSQTAQLQEKTKNTIENLSDGEALTLLKAKWITPLIQELLMLPDEITKNLISKLEYLQKKYSETLSDLDNQIAGTEKELCAMLGDLTGSDYDMRGIAQLAELMGGLG